MIILFCSFHSQNESDEILECLRFGKKSKQYRDAVRSFALTLHFYSPRAYIFVREKFNNHLPDPSSMRSWYCNSTGFGEPGLCMEALKTLGDLTDQLMQEENPKQLFVTLAFDEMNIRRHVDWNEAKNKFMGFISYGSKDKNGELPVARQALVFLVTGINFEMSIPIAHFFITTLKATQKAFLIREIIKEITKIGVKVVNITFDGLASNFSACRILGASFLMNDFRPFFSNPHDKSKIHIMLDACHMLKLIRNCIGSEKELNDGDGNMISWTYFEHLETYRIERSLCTHKLTKKHIQWERNKMNVQLAAQLMSRSVADSMDFCRKQNCLEFESSEATATFARNVNDLFDIFNSNNVESKIQFKKPLCRENASSVFSFLDHMSEYLKSLEIHGKQILNTRKRTGVKGFLINIINLKSIYVMYVEPGLMENLPTYRLSQDPLESLFGRIRSLNGNNDNPNVIQFTSGFRKILINRGITASKLANCEDKLQILSVSSRRQSQEINENIYYDAAIAEKVFGPLDEEERAEETIDTEDTEVLLEITMNTNHFLLDCGEEASIAKIGGFVQKKIQEMGRFDCACKQVLLLNSKVDESILPDNCSIPCISTVYVCKIANACFNKYRNEIIFDYDKLIQEIMISVDLDNVFVDYFECDESHKAGFVLYIIKEYIRIQATYIAKNLTLIEQKILCRKQLNKKIHFLGL